MHRKLRFITCAGILICLLLMFCACDALPDQLKTVRLTGEEKTVTVPLHDDGGLALSVDLHFISGGHTVTVLPVPEGASPHAVITYPADFDDYGFSAVQTGDEFSLSTAQDCNFTAQHFSVTLYADVSSYTLVGSLALTADAAQIPQQTLSLDVTGGAVIRMEHICADALQLKIDGAADVVLSGEAAVLTAVINGAGVLDAAALDAGDAAVTVNGIGMAKLKCEGTLNAEINGAGSILYDGTPTLTKTIDGLGTVSQLPDEAT